MRAISHEHHQSSAIRGGYLQASLRSLCSRPLALPSAPVAALRPPSAAHHQHGVIELPAPGHRPAIMTTPNHQSRRSHHAPQLRPPDRPRPSSCRKLPLSWAVRTFLTAIKDETTRRIVRPNCTCISPNRSRAQACRNVGNSARTRLGIPVNRGMTGMAEPSVAPSLYR